MVRFRGDTLPKTNSSPLKIVVSNGNLPFQRSIFRCKMLVPGVICSFNVNGCLSSQH